MDRDGGPDIERSVIQKLKLRGVTVKRDRPTPEFKVIDQDTIQIGDQVMTKPFVEKPVSGEDHNIHIYYHSSTGGGTRRLFRKVSQRINYVDPRHQLKALRSNLNTNLSIDLLRPRLPTSRVNTIQR